MTESELRARLPSASGTNPPVTCTDVTGCGATVTWEVFGEYY